MFEILFLPQICSGLLNCSNDGFSCPDSRLPLMIKFNDSEHKFHLLYGTVVYFSAAFYMDPFLCGCSACRKFWTSTFGSGLEQLLKPATDRVRETSEIFSMVDVKGGSHSLLKIGDMVRIPSGHKGSRDLKGSVSGSFNNF